MLGHFSNDIWQIINHPIQKNIFKNKAYLLLHNSSNMTKNILSKFGAIIE